MGQEHPCDWCQRAYRESTLVRCVNENCSGAGMKSKLLCHECRFKSRAPGAKDKAFLCRTCRAEEAERLRNQ